MMGKVMWVLALVVLLLVVPPSTSASYNSPFSKWRSLASLLHSMLSRVANHRASRGDLQGAIRVRKLMDAVGGGFKFWRRAGSWGWDYLINYSWRKWDYRDLKEVLHLFNECQSFLGELTRLHTDSERIEWVSANYKHGLKIAQKLLKKLLDLFNRSGALQECLVSIQREFIDGNLLRDALELSANDIQSLFHVAKDILSGFFASSSSSTNEEL